MAKWTILHKIAVEDWFDAALTKQADALNDRIADLVAKRQIADTQLGVSETDDPATVPVDFVVAVAGNHVLRLETLQAEMKLRRDLLGFWSDYDDGLAKAVDQAFDAHREAGRRLRKGLVGLGYSNEDNPATIGFIIPDFLARHPTVRTRRMEHDALVAKRGDRARARSNEESLAEIEREIRAALDKAAAAV